MLAIYDFERGSWKPDGPHNPNKKNKQEEGHKNTTEPVNKVRGKVLFN